MIPYGGIAPPIDWLMCDGTIYNIVTYPALGATLGATFGGDGVTTFAVPDCRGRSPIGAGQGGGLTNRALGQMVGVETHLLTLAESPSHTHNDSGHLHPDPGHVHPDPGHVHGDAGHNHPDPGHAHVYVDPGHPHPTPRAASVNDVFLSSNSSWGGDWGTGNLLWTNANTSGGSVSVSGAGLQIGYAAIAAAGANLQAVVTGLQAGYAVLTPAGGGQPHNNMSPSLGVNYIIKT
jgi:microcystin-dependent protein